VNNDEWVAAVTSYVRRSFGNTGGFVTPADVARVRALAANRTLPWTVQELTASLPAVVFSDSLKASASHNPDAAIGGLSLTTWSSVTPQQPGIWYQVELTTPRMVTELQFQSPAAGGRGAAVSPGGAPIATGQGPGFPRGYKVEVSMDGASWNGVAEGTGSGISTIVTFPAVQAKFVRMSLTTGVDSGPPWSIQGLRVYAVPLAGGKS
jgi:hypothetical protein